MPNAGRTENSSQSRRRGTSAARGAGRGKRTQETRHVSHKHVESKPYAKRSARDEGVKRDKGSAGEAKAGDMLGRFLPKGKLRVVSIVLFVIVLSVAIVYPAARPYYTAVRDGQRYDAQLAAVQERNDALKEETEALKTNEGIEAQARNDYGYVKKGDKSAVVTNAKDSSASNTKPGQVDIDAIKAPKTWYYSILDKVFFYNGG